MPFVLVFILAISVFGEDFISPMEYAKMLYQNPRGIGCNACHGIKGEGKVIAKYRHKNKNSGKNEQKSLKAPAINNISKISFIKALKKSQGIMPTYFLTDFEMESLYYYVQQYSKKK